MIETRKILLRPFQDTNGKIVLAQFPNVPLIMWLTCTLANYLIANASLSHWLSALGTLSLGVWAVWELVSGVTYFRRFLGLSVLLLTIYQLV